MVMKRVAPERTTLQLRQLELLQRRDDPRAVEELIKSVERYVVMRAAHYAQQWHLDTETDDLIAEGRAGVLYAIRRFDESKGAMFLTYANNWIDATMRRWLGQRLDTIYVPRTARQRAKRGVDLGTFDGANLVARVWRGNGSLGNTTASGLAAAELVGSGEPDAERSLIEREMVGKVRIAITRLHPKERLAIEGRIANETLREIGQRLGVSRERVRQLEARAIWKLRQAFGVP